MPSASQIIDTHPVVRTRSTPRFISSVAETYSTRLLLGVLALANAVLIARILGPENRGLFAVATAITTIAIQLGNLGLHAANTYHVARDIDVAPELVGNSLLVGLGFGSLIAVIGLVVLFLFPQVAPVQGPLLVTALIFVPIGLAYLLLQNLLLGIHEVRAYNLIELLARAIALCLVVGLWFTKRSSTETLFVAAMSSTLIGLLWTGRHLQSTIRRRIGISLAIFKQTISVGLRAYWVALFAFLVLRVDLLMVKYLKGAADAGYYSIAATMTDYIGMLPVVMGTILFPKLSSLPEINARLQLTRKATALTALIMLPTVVLAALFARPLVELLFGAAFLASSDAFVLLLPGIFFLSMEVVLVQFLNSVGFPISVVLCWITTCIINIALNLWAIPRYGMNGASVVSSVTYFLAFVLVLILTGMHTRTLSSEPIEEVA